MARLVAAFIAVTTFGLVACSSDNGGSGAKPDAGSACLGRPETLPRPPAGKLPCELIPPGLSLE